MIDIRPAAASLRMFPAMNYSPWFALGEFVDTSITGSKQNDDRLRRLHKNIQLKVDIRFDEGAGVIEIEDNAAGIAKADLPRASDRVPAGGHALPVDLRCRDEGRWSLVGGR